MRPPSRPASPRSGRDSSIATGRRPGPTPSSSSRPPSSWTGSPRATRGPGSSGVGPGLERLEDPEELADAADEEPLLVDLDPDAGRRREDDVVAGLHRHLDPGLFPPVEAGTDREHDSLLRRRLVASRRHDQARAADAVRVELLDDDLVEQGAELVANRFESLSAGGAHPDEG